MMQTSLQNNKSCVHGALHSFKWSCVFDLPFFNQWMSLSVYYPVVAKLGPISILRGIGTSHVCVCHNYKYRKKNEMGKQLEQSD